MAEGWQGGPGLCGCVSVVSGVGAAGGRRILCQHPRHSGSSYEFGRKQGWGGDSIWCSALMEVLTVALPRKP